MPPPRIALLTALSFGAAALSSSAACGSADPGPTVVEASIPTAVESASAAPSSSASSGPRFAHRARSGESALDIVVNKGATAWMTIDVETIRASPIADALAKIMPFRRSMKKAGVEPQRDFDRVLASVHPSLTLIEHHLDAMTVDRFLGHAVNESEEGAKRKTVNGKPCATLKNKNGRGTACPIADGLLMISSLTSLDLAEKLAAADLPLPPNGEVAHIEVLDGQGIFKYVGFDNTLGAGAISVLLQPDLGLRFDGKFASEHPSIDQKAMQDHVLLPGLDVGMEQGAVKVFLDVKPDDADALVAVLKVVGG